MLCSFGASAAESISFLWPLSRKHASVTGSSRRGNSPGQEGYSGSLKGRLSRRILVEEHGNNGRHAATSDHGCCSCRLRNACIAWRDQCNTKELSGCLSLFPGSTTVQPSADAGAPARSERCTIARLHPSAGAAQPSRPLHARRSRIRNAAAAHLGGHLDVLLLLGLLALGLALEDGLAVRVELERGDDNVGGVDADLDGRPVGLVLGHAVDVDDPLLAVDLMSQEGTADQLVVRVTTRTAARTWTTLPSRPLYLPRMTRTSSSLRMGIERTCRVVGKRDCFCSRTADHYPPSAWPSSPCSGTRT